MTSMSLAAYDFEVDGICYNQLTDSTVEVTNRTPSYTGQVIVPEKVLNEGREYVVSSVGKMAFYDCSKLSGVELPNTIVTIGEKAFWGSEDITSITIPNSVITIQAEAFGYCYGLSNVTIGNSVTTIGEEAFMFCDFESIEIPNSVTKIGESAFYGCEQLKEVILGENVLFIEERAFEGDYQLEYVTCLAQEPPLVFNGAFEFSLPYDCVLIRECTSTGPQTEDPSWAGGASLPSVLRVPEENIQAYRESYFWSRFTTIASLDAVLEKSTPPVIHAQAVGLYDECNYQAVLHFTFEDTNGGHAAFLIGKTEGDLQIIGSNMEWNGDCMAPCKDMYSGNSFFMAYSIAAGKTRSDMTVYQVKWDDFYVSCHDFMKDGIFYSILSDSTVAVTREKEDLNLYRDPFLAYEYQGDPCPSYSGEVVIPSHVEYGGVDYKVTEIKNEAFFYCDVPSVVIPNSVERIGYGAFLESTLASIDIPSSVTSIDASFQTCFNLSRVTCHATTPPSVRGDDFMCNAYDWYNFDSDSCIYSTAKLFVPNESLEAYRAHEEWGRFSNIVPFIGAGPGDANGDGVINVSDVTSLIDLLLSGEDEPAWVDVNGDGVVNVSDVTTLIDQLLAGD